MGATPRLTVGIAARCEIRGDLEQHFEVERDDRWFE